MDGLFGEMQIGWWLAQLEDYNWAARERACRRLGELKQARAVEPLIARLEDEDAAVRRAACLALGNINNLLGREPLLESMADRDGAVRHAAYDALHAMGLGAVAELVDNPAPEQATPPLSEREREFIQPIIQRWLTSPSLRRRWMACNGLGRLGGAAAMPALLERLTDEHWQVQQAAITALGRLKDAGAIDALIPLLRHADPVIRQSACAALGEIGDKQVVPPILAALRDEAPLVRVEACRVLARLGDAEVVPALMTGLADADAAVREALCQALGALRDPRAEESLLARVGDKSPLVGKAASDALKRLGDVRAVDGILAQVGTLSGDALSAACQTLKQLGGGSLADILLLVLHNDPEVVTALKSANMDDRQRLLSVLLAWAGNPDPLIRASSCRALGFLRDAQAMEPLIAAMRDASRETRIAACQALTAFRDARIVAPAIERLSDEFFEVQAEACDLLGAQGDRQAIIPLIWQISTGSHVVRMAACLALEALEEPIAATLRMALQGDAGATEALTALITRGDMRVVGPLTELAQAIHGFDADMLIAFHLVTTIWKALRPHAGMLLCTTCLARVVEETIERPGGLRAHILTCRQCHSAATLALDIRDVIAVLADDMPDEVVIAGHAARVNAGNRSALFDFNRVEVGKTTDFAIEHFCMLAGNDTDPRRTPHYRTMPVMIHTDSGISENARRVLDHVFGDVIFVTGEEMSTEFYAGAPAIKGSG